MTQFLSDKERHDLHILHTDDPWAFATAIEAAVLAQLANGQEPVAWRFTQNRGNGKTEYTYHDNTVENNHKLAYKDNCLKIEALYLRAPAPASAQQPLSDEQIFTACENVLCVYPNAKTTLDIARAIEATLRERLAQLASGRATSLTAPQIETVMMAYLQCSSGGLDSYGPDLRKGYEDDVRRILDAAQNITQENS